MPAAVTHCLECEAPLTSSEMGGLCPKCLLKLGLASQFSTSGVSALAEGVLPNGAFTEPFHFGHYRILRLLGRGGMGAVYEAEDRENGRRVAVKVLGHTLDTAEMRRRFLREAQLAASVRHENLVAVFGAEEIEGVPLISMELVLNGALKDLVTRRGMLPVSEAVDAILQVISGLESAHTAGVLHRDIKPANCFVSPDGTVKVGDFGLSISTLAKAEAQLTLSGAVLGTPAFASPEQLRGQEIDLRSDIYAVGATLYYLLTGKPTHESEGLVSLIASVLEKSPPDPAILRPEIPRPLSRVVMRCLAREPGARFQTYAALRDALLPFSSGAPSPAMLRLRFLAGFIDIVALSLVSVIWTFVRGNRPIDQLIISGKPGAWLEFLAATALEVFYLAFFEGFFGLTLGKALCGLRVVRRGTLAAPGVWRGLGRAAFFLAPEWIGIAIAAITFTHTQYERSLSKDVFLWTDAVSALLFLLLFVTLRRRNGYAAVHDLCTGTRVVTRPQASARPSLSLAPIAAPALDSERIGPFAVVERQGDLITAWDEALRRPVWIKLAPYDTPSLDSKRTELSRPSRLRWLAGRRSPDLSWDAFEAPLGIPYTRLQDRSQPWSSVRFWLSDLAEEVNAGLAEGSLPESIGLDQLWLTREGRLLLLDFTAPGAVPSEKYPIRSSGDLQAVLSTMAQRALHPRIPLHARELLTTLRRGGFEATAIVAGNLRSLLHRPATVSRQRRLFSLILPIGMALINALIGVGVIVQTNRDFDRAWARQYAPSPSLRAALEVSKSATLSAAQKEALSIYVAGHFKKPIQDPEFWQVPATLAEMDPFMRGFAKDSVARHPTVAPERLKQAEKEVAEPLRAFQEWDQAQSALLPPILFLGFLVAFLSLGAICAPFLRAPFGLWLIGAALVNRRGEPAGRLRTFLRSCWLVPPLFAGIVALFLLAEETHLQAAIVLTVASLLTLLAGAVLAMLRPERGLLDRLSGTFLVPR